MPGVQQEVHQRFRAKVSWILSDFFILCMECQRPIEPVFVYVASVRFQRSYFNICVEAVVLDQPAPFVFDSRVHYTWEAGDTNFLIFQHMGRGARFQMYVPFSDVRF